MRVPLPELSAFGYSEVGDVHRQPRKRVASPPPGVLFFQSAVLYLLEQQTGAFGKTYQSVEHIAYSKSYYQCNSLREIRAGQTRFGRRAKAPLVKLHGF